ncbi:MAG: carbohydrate ABC transporter substrate-binding protein [Ruminococcus sp.]|nr:carbohydrate ABC transporter substrate-binding protein [Ruminococcus sp.]
MRKTRISAAAALMTAAVMTLSSCSFKHMIVMQSRRDISVPTTISFSWWGSEARNSYTLEGIRTFEKDYDSRLEVHSFPYDFEGYKSNLDALVRSGKEYDIMQLNSSWVQSLTQDYDALYDLNELSDYIELSNFSDEQLSYCTVDGKLCGLPTSLNALTFYHNTLLYANYELNPPTTWDELFAAAEVMSPDGVYVLESNVKHYWIMSIAHEEQLTGRSAFGDGFDAENVVSMMEFYKSLRDEKVIPTETYTKELFFEGGCASEVMWVSDAEFYAEPLNSQGGLLQVGSCLKSDDQKRTGWYVKPNQVYSIKKSTEHPEEAAQLLNFLVNDSRMAKLQGTEKGIPLSSSALEVLEANNMLNGASYEAGKLINDNISSYELMPAQLEETERYEAFFEQFTLFDSGEKTAQQAAEDFVAEYPFT